jgi:regulation of enolase protein 1 (concanavalin A-like superfamily)
MQAALGPARRIRLFLFAVTASSSILWAGCRDAGVEHGRIESQTRALVGVWTGTDIGATAAGSSSNNGTTHTVTGGGADIWGTADAFRFVSMTVTGNSTITARVASLSPNNPPPDAFTKIGLMMRETLAPGAKEVMALVTPTAANQYRIQSRTATNGTTSKVNGANSQIPVWLRLSRSGTTFTASYSTSTSTTVPTTFTTIGTATVSMANTIEVGLAVTSHTTSQLATVVFEGVTIEPPQTPPAPPPAPTGLTASAGNGQVSLTWSAAAGATSYNVKWSTTSGGPYTVTPGITTTSHTVSGLTNGQPYHFVVSAANGSGESANSTQVTATPALPPAPPAPTGVTATAGNAQVSLTWAAAAGATSYTVKSGTTLGGPYPDVFPGITATSYTHGGLPNGVARYYVVSASNAGGEGPNSAERSATPTAPPPVTWTSKIIGTVASGATGSWSQNGTTHTLSAGGADIYGAADNFRFTYQSITGDFTLTARVQSLSNANTWSKAVVMVRENDTAGARNVATVISPTATNKYRRQARLTAGGTSTSDPSTANSALPSWIRLQRVGTTFTSAHSTNGTTWTPLAGSATLSIGATALVGLGVCSHTTTANTTATAVFTDVSIVTPAPPQAPTNLTATPGNNQVHLTWSASTGAATYVVKRATSPSGPFTTIASNIVDTRYTNTGLTNGNTYHFTVAAVNPSGSSGDSSVVTASPLLLRPSVRSISPLDGATNVATDVFVALDLIMPNVGGGVSEPTLTSANVYLRRASDNQAVPATLNTSGGSDVVVLQPTTALQPNTTYAFFLTDQLQDATGAPFVPFSSSFTTGNAPPPPPADVAFDKVSLGTTVTGYQFTSVSIGPDNKLYAGTITGQLLRWVMNANGTLGTREVIDTIRSNNGAANRAIIGLAWDPSATSSNLILWVTHGGAALLNAPDWSGKLSRLSGTALATYADKVINFPRSAKDHMTNSLTFRPGEPGVIYITQGSMNAMGAPDNAWSQRSEHLLSATILRVDTALLPTGALNVQTNDADPAASGYNPFAANAPVTIWATGVRNAYDLLWHSNGELYTATNGSAAGGSTPATTSPLPSACSRRIDGSPYTGPTVPAITGNPVAEDDYLYRIVQGGYYGHPNPARCEWVLNGGNPTSGADNTEVTAYPVGVQPDRNWRGNVFNFGAHYSPNGMIEWRSNVFPQLVGKLLIIRYSGGDDIIVLTINPTTKGIASTQTGITGMGGFLDPLDLIHNPSTGHIYVTEYSDAAPASSKITLLRPRLP